MDIVMWLVGLCIWSPACGWLDGWTDGRTDGQMDGVYF